MLLIFVSIGVVVIASLEAFLSWPVIDCVFWYLCSNNSVNVGAERINNIVNNRNTNNSIIVKEEEKQKKTQE